MPNIAKLLQVVRQREAEHNELMQAHAREAIPDFASKIAVKRQKLNNAYIEFGAVVAAAIAEHGQNNMLDAYMEADHTVMLIPLVTPIIGLWNDHKDR